jgi:hypothetical protein
MRGFRLMWNLLPSGRCVRDRASVCLACGQRDLQDASDSFVSQESTAKIARSLPLPPPGRPCSHRERLSLQIHH